MKRKNQKPRTIEKRPFEAFPAHHVQLQALIRHLARISAQRDYEAFLKRLPSRYDDAEGG